MTFDRIVVVFVIVIVIVIIILLSLLIVVIAITITENNIQFHREILKVQQRLFVFRLWKSKHEALSPC